MRWPMASKRLWDWPWVFDNVDMQVEQNLCYISGNFKKKFLYTNLDQNHQTLHLYLEKQTKKVCDHTLLCDGHVLRYMSLSHIIQVLQVYFGVRSEFWEYKEYSLPMSLWLYICTCKWKY